MVYQRAQRPRKRFGQHFLKQASVARRIVALAELDGDETVLEIGPGRGALTSRLATCCGRLVLVELDRDLTERLRQRFAGDPSVEIVGGDILRIDLAQLLHQTAPVVVVANLPYNISTPVLMTLLDAPRRFSRLVLMLQREVARRIVAPPGSRTYGALSVMVQLVADVRRAFSVRPTAFTPVPRVESEVVVVEPRRPQVHAPRDLRAIRNVVRVAFSHRRKQLGNTLAPFGEAAQAALAELDIDTRRRAETLSVEEFVALTEVLSRTANAEEPGTGGPTARRESSR